MRTLRAIYHLMRADWLERVRRPSHLLLSGSMLFLVYWAVRGGLIAHVADHRGVFNSAWSGFTLAFWGSLTLSLFGFYVVKSAVHRDRETRAGEVLAATPVSRYTYLLGKCLSNFAVLAGAVAMLALGALVLQLVRRESTSVDVWPLLSPFLGVALPVIFLTAAAALCFECLPVLSGGVGNITYFFLWVLVLDRCLETHDPYWDLFAMKATERSIVASAQAQLAGIGKEATLSMQGGPVRTLDPHHFVWHGLHWTPDLIALRLFWIGVALGMVAVAAVFFDRFDPARSREVRRGRLSRFGDRLARLTLRQPQWPALSFRNRFLTLVAVELRLLLRGHRWWWYLGALGMYVASLIASPAEARAGLLPALWIWPVLAWSGMGTLENRWGTAELIASSPRPQARQLPALWLSGVLVGAALVSGVALRSALAGEFDALCVAGVGVLLVPSAALALGVLSGTPRAFEAVYAIAWYGGPLQHEAALDFAGTSAHPSLHYLPWHLLLAGLLLLTAWAARARQLRM
jgi:hypothetical protein